MSSRPIGDVRVAWVTGASSGIGRALALELAASGARVAATARRADELEALAADAQARGGEIVPFPADVTDAAACDASLLLVQSQVDTPLDADLVSHLHAANYAPFRIGSWLIGLRPGRLQVPLDELLHFFRRGVDQTDADE